MEDDCPDCGVTPGQGHLEGCDVARCPECGWQRIGGRHVPTAGWGTWTGLWPGVIECREFGYLMSGPLPEDLNALSIAASRGEVVWDRQAQRWRKLEWLAGT
jgi:hypothetical protein